MEVCCYAMRDFFLVFLWKWTKDRISRTPEFEISLEWKLMSTVCVNKTNKRLAEIDPRTC